MIKKVLAVVLVAVSVILPCGARAASTDQFEGHWELDTTRTVIFASDGGTYIHPAQQEIGTVICLDEYVPTKDGYIFDGLKLSILVDIFLQGFFSNVSSSEGADLKPLRSVATKRFQIAARPISLYHAALLTESSYLRRFSIGGSPPLAVQILRLFQ